MNQSNSVQKVKSAIIGKAWLNGQNVGIMPASFELPTDMTFQKNESYLIGNLSFRTDRNSDIPVTLKAGQKLFFYANTKRPGKNDPDYSVSVLLPEAEAEAFIEASREGSEEWKKEHATA